MLPLTGCSLVPGSGGTELVVRSTLRPVSLSSDFPTAVYLHTDNNTADIYLSDLPLESIIDPAADLRDRSGQVIHIHLFLMPQAGRTPIDSTACNFTVRHLVLAGGQAGMYSGGGFILPASEPGSRWFTASVRDATLRLARTDAGFSDRLGVSTLSGSVSARRDEDRTRAIAARVESLINSLPDAPRPPAPK